jgi:hypothetical protein
MGMTYGRADMTVHRRRSRLSSTSHLSSASRIDTAVLQFVCLFPHPELWDI